MGRDGVTFAFQLCSDFIIALRRIHSKEFRMLTTMLAIHLALYVGPDQLMPLTSILGAIGGALLIFWRQVVGVFKRIGQMFSREK